MWKRAQERFRTRSLVATIVLILIITLASFVYVVAVRSYIRQQSYTRLKESTIESIDAIEGEFRGDRSMLRMIARIISESDESLHSLSVAEYLNIYDLNSLISNVAILTSDNSVIRVSGMDLDATGVLDFEEISTKGEHISVLQRDLESPSVYDLRSFVPIRRDGETIAFIYGTTTPEDIVNAWVPDIYDGKAIISVIDRETGTILIDGNNRTNIPIEDANININSISIDMEFVDAIMQGRRGFAIGREPDISGKVYYCFLPMDIEPWEMVVAV
ncbi:MAG: hypothetical protein IJ675_03525, partial [Pseudobutyrivibrio sp.]|nr:hypothetical protein [Pseudobutyrivibrio sp.]